MDWKLISYILLSSQFFSNREVLAAAFFNKLLQWNLPKADII